MSSKDLAQARAWFAAGRFEAALQAARSLLARAPQDPSALAIAANAAMQIGADDVAVACLQRLLVLRPGDELLQRNLSRVYNRIGGLRFAAFTDRLAGPNAHLHRLDGDPDQAANAIRALDLDLAVYPEIGMDARILPLAALPLARRQWMGAATGRTSDRARSVPADQRGAIA